jgi:hypothetical protein
LTFGDVLAVVAALVGICLSAWTTLLAFSLLVPGRAEQAAASIRQSPTLIGLRGFGLTLLMVIAAIILFKIPQPIFKAMAWLDLLAMLSLAALGGSGLAMVMARRVRDQEPQLSAYAALMRGAALVVVPGLLPVFGWFLVAPIMLIVGIGAGTKALRLAPVSGQV